MIYLVVGIAHSEIPVLSVTLAVLQGQLEPLAIAEVHGIRRRLPVGQVEASVVPALESLLSLSSHV